MTKYLTLVAAAAALAAAPAASRAPRSSAVARLFNVDGRQVGKATIAEYGGRLHLTLNVQHQAPGDHGLHIHTIGVCAPPEFASAGGHWNPTMHQHGTQNPMGPHAGDMPDLHIGENGRGSARVDLGAGSLSGGASPLLDADGASIVIHEKADDMKTDPSGNSGKRLVCGAFK